MTEASVRAIIQELNQAKVRYLVVGGLAVNAHGYVRNTMDIDFLIAFDAENLLAALRAFKRLGYEPKVPVKMEEFADPAKRESWIREKNMLVFGLRSKAHQETDVDIFVSDPLGFDDAYRRVHYQPLVQEIVRTLDPLYSTEDDSSDSQDVLDVPFCSYDDLIKLKMAAGRPRDMDDIERLRISRGES